MDIGTNWHALELMSQAQLEDRLLEAQIYRQIQESKSSRNIQPWTVRLGTFLVRLGTQLQNQTH